MLLRSTGVIWLILTSIAPWVATFSVQSPRRGVPTSSPSSSSSVSSCTSLCLAKSQTAKDRLTLPWFPKTQLLEDDIFAKDERYDAIEQNSLTLMASIIQNKLNELKWKQDSVEESPSVSPSLVHNSTAYTIAKGRFLDLTCTHEGEKILEQLFQSEEAAQIQDRDIIHGAIIALQSLCIAATQVGIKGTPEQLQRMVSHLRVPKAIVDVTVWNEESIRRLKYEVDQTAGTQLLATLKWKRSSQGALELLVALGAWSKHEDISILRSGFPIRFTDEQLAIATTATISTHDPDTILDMRKDLTQQKIYTIDSASTYEIDDGLAVEILDDTDGIAKYRYWIHIADADRWAPRQSEIFELGQRRWTSHYLPGYSIPMFPSILSQGVMSLKANTDVCALSLGVVMNPDGSIDTSSIEVTPSMINVSYRLTYEEVNEMLEEGVGYSEEWQLGALLAAAKVRRNYRIENGSSEAMIPNPMPQGTVSTFSDENSPDGIGIRLEVEATHNSGKNVTADAESGTPNPAAPASPSFMLVTEMMIMAGEALGAWKLRCDQENRASTTFDSIDNCLRLPFRTQPKPDFLARSTEYNIMQTLLESNAGGGYCQAWYARRFFTSVKVSEIANPHSGLGIDSYVQWTSPIRRLSDLLVHCSVKRYLRRQKVIEIIQHGKSVPTELTFSDLGCPVPCVGAPTTIGRDELDTDIDYGRGQALVTASRQMQRNAQQYWLFEYITRQMEIEPPVFDAIVLGCVDHERLQYAIYLPSIGFEHKYLSEKGELHAGDRLSLRVSSVMSRTGLLTLTLSNV